MESWSLNSKKYTISDDMRKNSFRSIDPSRWLWQVGSILTVLGATEGAVAALVFAWAQNKNLSHGLPSQENGFRFTLLIIAGFIISGIFALFSTASKRFSKIVRLMVLILGLVLTILSILSAFSIGMITFYGAIFVLLGGVLLILASLLQPL